MIHALFFRLGLATACAFLFLLTSGELGLAGPFEDQQHDEALHRELRKEIEAIPEDSRLQQGAQILEANVERFRTDDFRQRVKLSIGELNAKLGNLDEAKKSLGEAAVGSNPFLREVSGERLVDQLAEEGRYDDAIEQALLLRQESSSEEAYASLTHRAAIAAINSGHSAQAVDLVIELAERQKSENAYSILRTVGSLSKSKGDRESYERATNWLINHGGQLASNPDFLGSLAIDKQAQGDLEGSITIRKQLIQDFPNSRDVASHTLAIAQLNYSLGNKKEAKEYFEQIINSDYSEEYKTLAKQSLDILEGRDPSATDAPSTASGSFGLWIVVVNILLFLAIAAYFLWKRYSVI